MGLTLMQKIDVMDGRLDGKYGKHKLSSKAYTFAACKRSRWRGVIKTWLESHNGSSFLLTKVTVDCKQQWRKLKTLTDIAGKMPQQRIFMARATKKRVRTLPKPNKQDKFGHFIVNLMLIRLLMGKLKSSDSFANIFSQTFSSKPLSCWLIPYLGNKINVFTPSKNVDVVYEAFKRLGIKYSFSTTAFK